VGRVRLYIRGDWYACPDPLTLDPYPYCELNCRYRFIKQLDSTALKRKVSDNRPLDVSALKNLLKRLKRGGLALSEAIYELPIYLGRKCEPFGPRDILARVTPEIIKILTDYGLKIAVESKFTPYYALPELMEADLAFNVSVCPGPTELWAELEPEVPPKPKRFEFARILSEAGVWVGLTAEPILHGIADKPEHIAEYVSSALEVGVEHINFGDFRIHNVKSAYFAMKEAGISLLDIFKAKRGWPEDSKRIFFALKDSGLLVSSVDWVNLGLLSDCVSCCGLDWLGYHKLNFQYALRVLREKGEVRLSDLGPKPPYIGQKAYEKFVSIWNGENTNYFTLSDVRGVTPYFGRGPDGNLVYTMEVSL